MKRDNALSLKLTPTYGSLGSPRSPQFIAGESFCMMLDVSGLDATDANGFTDISITSEIHDAMGKVILNFSTKHIKSRFGLGGSSARYPALFNTTRDFSPGKYKISESVVDHNSGRKATAEYPVDILPRSTLGILNLKFSRDENGASDASGVMVVNEPICVTGTIGGLKEINGRAHFKIRLSILDENRKPILGDPVTKDFERDFPNTPDILFSIHLSTTPNRPGKFVFEITATDVVADKTVCYELPVTVLMPPELPVAKR